MPRTNSASPRQWRKFLERATGENPWFGKISIGDWRGHYFKQSKYSRRWAGRWLPSLRTPPIGNQRGPRFGTKFKKGDATILKSSPSGDIWETTATIHGNLLAVIIKRPYKRYWYRYINEIGRGSRARRAWTKAWKLIARNIPTAWPLLHAGEAALWDMSPTTSSFSSGSKAKPSPPLDLDALTAPSARLDVSPRQAASCGRLIPLGMAHLDAKASNWMITDDPQLGPCPVLIDVDGVRLAPLDCPGHPPLPRAPCANIPSTHRPILLALCRGYAPNSRIAPRYE